jgi:23S rRNA (cytosine1962-C5)-methyltransferase
VRAKVDAALARRRVLAPVSERDNAHRLIFSEADELPGIVADRYNDLVLLQLLTQGTAQDDVREVVVDALREAFAGSRLTVWERPDTRIRELEQLAAPAPGPLFASGEAVATTEFMLNGLRFEYDAGAGQKTGAFLDQRLNYAAAARWVEASRLTGKALDICTYQGGFALHLAQVCERVTGVDASRASLEAADRNLERNPQLRGETDWIEADAFELMRAYDDAARNDATRKYDAIVLDPPAFAKSKRAAEGALRGYKELNLRALRMFNAGGTLVTCSCSHHVGLEEFTAVVTAAAADAGRRVQLLETRAAAPDHPEILSLPETRYLKCLILRVD